MRFKLNDQELHLRRLNDAEFEYAEGLARTFGTPISKCPTCGIKQDDDPEAEVEPTFKFRGEVHECNCRVQIALYMRYLIAGIPDEYMRLDWDRDYTGDGSAKVFVNDYLEHWQGYRKQGFGAEFGGPQMGIGKTFAATHIGKTLIKQGQRVYFTPFIEMVAAFEKENGEELEQRIRMTPFVILDDIMEPHSERQKHFYHSRFEAIIRHRTNYSLPTIITTNLRENQLDNYYPRTYSLLSAKQIRIDMDGEDVRRSGKLQTENVELVWNGEVRPIT